MSLTQNIISPKESMGHVNPIQFIGWACPLYDLSSTLSGLLCTNKEFGTKFIENYIHDQNELNSFDFASSEQFDNNSVNFELNNLFLTYQLMHTMVDNILPPFLISKDVEENSLVRIPETQSSFNADEFNDITPIEDLRCRVSFALTAYNKWKARASVANFVFNVAKSKLIKRVDAAWLDVTADKDNLLELTSDDSNFFLKYTEIEESVSILESSQEELERIMKELSSVAVMTPFKLFLKSMESAFPAASPSNHLNPVIPSNLSLLKDTPKWRCPVAMEEGRKFLTEIDDRSLSCSMPHDLEGSIAMFSGLRDTSLNFLTIAFEKILLTLVMQQTSGDGNTDSSEVKLKNIFLSNAMNRILIESNEEKEDVSEGGVDDGIIGLFVFIDSVKSTALEVLSMVLQGCEVDQIVKTDKEVDQNSFFTSISSITTQSDWESRRLNDLQDDCQDIINFALSPYLSRILAASASSLSSVNSIPRDEILTDEHLIPVLQSFRPLVRSYDEFVSMAGSVMVTWLSDPYIDKTRLAQLPLLQPALKLEDYLPVSLEPFRPQNEPNKNPNMKTSFKSLVFAFCGAFIILCCFFLFQWLRRKISKKITKTKKLENTKESVKEKKNRCCNQCKSKNRPLLDQPLKAVLLFNHGICINPSLECCLNSKVKPNAIKSALNNLSSKSSSLTSFSPTTCNPLLNTVTDKNDLCLPSTIEEHTSLEFSDAIDVESLDLNFDVNRIGNAHEFGLFNWRQICNVPFMQNSIVSEENCCDHCEFDCSSDQDN